MSEPGNPPPVPPKQRKTPRAKVAARNHPAPQAGAALPVSPPEPPVQPPASEPPGGEKWGEFPSLKRQAELKEKLEAWEQEQDHGERPGPFANVELTGADVYWLAALTAGKGDVGVGKKELDRQHLTELSSLHLEKATLINAHLEGAYLEEAHLERAWVVKAHLERAWVVKAHLERAYMPEAQLQGAFLNGAQLQDAFLPEAQLQGAILYMAQLQRAGLNRAQLQGALLNGAQVQGADLEGAKLQGASLRGALLDAQTKLAGAPFNSTVNVADVGWNDVPLIQVDWNQVPRIGDEKGLPGTAARAYRQLAIALREQGVYEAADRFTYRALIMQRKDLWLDIIGGGRFSKLGAYLFSLFLAVLTGYGFRLWRIIAAYTLLIFAFAGVYWILDTQPSHAYTFWQTLILSVTAFHGRVFSNPYQLTEPQIAVTAIEAIFGLVIEGVFIAMLTQRFFNR